MSRTIRTALVVAVLLMAKSSDAELRAVDLFNLGDALLTRDTKTNLEWLDVTYVKGGGRSAGESFIAGTGGALGFRYAKQSEIATLCKNAGIAHASTDIMWWTTDYSGIQRLQSLLGIISSTGIGTPLSGGPYGPLTIGIADYDITPSERFYSPLVSLEIWTAQQAGRATLYDGKIGDNVSMNIGWDNLGHYMVRNVPNATTNGTPRQWMEQHNLFTDTTDPDLDGYLSWQEYICGTDPTNKQSCFIVTITDSTLSWDVATNRIYSIEQSTNLAIGFTQITNGLVTSPFAIPTTNDAMCFRVKVQLAK